MNFQSLKSMVEGLIKNFKCPECSSSVTDENIDIIGAAGSTINIDITCPNCKKHSMVKTEVMALNLSEKGISKENIDKLKDALVKGGLTQNNKVKPIKDEEIVELNKDLKKDKLDVSDLLG